MTQTANNYATVLLELGVTREAVDETKEILSLTQDLPKSLKSPVVSKQDKHKLIDRIFPESMKNFLKVVCDYGEADLLEEIFAAYDVVEAEKNGILQAKLEYVLEPTEDEVAQMAVDEINAAGGANGYQLAFKAEDDQNDAEKSVNAYNSLKDWGMQILMGTVTTTPCVAVADKTAEDGMFEITPSASSTDVITNDNVFQACFTDPNQGTASAQYIADNNLGTKVAVIYDSSSVYSSGIEATFVEEAQNKGLEVVAEEAFTADSKTDFSTQLQKAQSAGADLVFLPIYYTEASIILTQANGMGYEPAFFGVDGMDGILGVENFDTSLAEGVMLLTPFAADADDEKTKAFVSTYKEKYGDVPNQFADLL